MANTIERIAQSLRMWETPKYLRQFMEDWKEENPQFPISLYMPDSGQFETFNSGEVMSAFPIAIDLKGVTRNSSHQGCQRVAE